MEETMMRASTVGLLALFCVAAVGCAAVKEQKAMANAPTANVVGRWSGYAGQGASGVPVTLTLAQAGTDVTGNVTVAARPDLSGPVKGAVQGELLKLSLATVTFSQLEVKGDTMTGMTGAGQVILRRSK
ncbi:MAG: hypothetical protein DME03_18070 [Candidatus Rokuibacteriota bacterium]|nr:MAG: hypothetical protein DME03_18070 [Candidatus Rokubacteria bacterium]